MNLIDLFVFIVGLFVQPTNFYSTHTHTHTNTYTKHLTTCTVIPVSYHNNQQPEEGARFCYAKRGKGRCTVDRGLHPTGNR